MRVGGARCANANTTGGRVTHACLDHWCSTAAATTTAQAATATAAILHSPAGATDEGGGAVVVGAKSSLLPAASEEAAATSSGDEDEEAAAASSSDEDGAVQRAMPWTWDYKGGEGGETVQQVAPTGATVVDDVHGSCTLLQGTSGGKDLWLDVPGRGRTKRTAGHIKVAGGATAAAGTANDDTTTVEAARASLRQIFARRPRCLTGGATSFSAFRLTPAPSTSMATARRAPRCRRGEKPARTWRRCGPRWSGAR